jgi:hypothetical protein
LIECCAQRWKFRFGHNWSFGCSDHASSCQAGAPSHFGKIWPRRARSERPP